MSVDIASNDRMINEQLLEMKWTEAVLAESELRSRNSRPRNEENVTPSALDLTQILRNSKQEL
jgi:hypothetical protein